MHSYTEYEIYDAHTHIFPQKIAEKAAIAIGNFYESPMRYNGMSSCLLESGAKINIKKYLVCSTATVPQQTSSINDFIIEECKIHPEFIGFGTLHPDMENMDDEIEKIISSGLYGIKIHPDFQKFNIDEKKAYKIYEKILGKLPILIHLGDDRYDYSRPFRLVNVLKDFPDLEVFAAHLGGYQRWGESIELLSGYSKIHFDTSSTLGFVSTEYAREVIKHFNIDNLMFGTDFPMWDHAEELERFFALGLSDEDNKKILGGNFKRIFNL